MPDFVLCSTRVEWREVGDTDIDKPWIRNLTCPSAGEVRWASLDADWRASDDRVWRGQRRWLLYETNNAYYNGYEENFNSDDLDICSVVEVEILTVLPVLQIPRHDWQGSKRFWVETRCLQSVALAHIPDVFPVIQPTTKQANRLDATYGRTVTLYETQISEVQDWYVVTNASVSRHVLPHIVLSGLSLDSYCFISNWVVEVGKDYWKAS